MNYVTVSNLVDQWTQILGIDGWKIHVRVVPHTRLRINGNDEMLGLTVFDEDSRTAHVWVADDDAPHNISFEFTLLHELAHIFIADVTLTNEEAVVNGIARALYLATGRATELANVIEVDTGDADAMNDMLSAVLQEVSKHGGIDAIKE